MEKRHLYRSRCLKAAAAAVTLAGLSSFNNSASAAGLSLSLTTHTTDATQGAFSASISTLSPVTLDLWATVTGTNGVGTDDLLQEFNANVIRTGSTTGSLGSPTLFSLFKGSGAQDSTTTPASANADLNGDTFADIGSTTNSDATGWLYARAGSPVRSVTVGAVGFTAAGSFAVKVGTLTFTPGTLG